MGLAGLIGLTPTVKYWGTIIKIDLTVLGLVLFFSGLIGVGLVVAVGAHQSILRRKNWFKKYSKIEALKSMPWEEFEDLTAAAFRKWGFKVHHHGGAQADGGIDLIVHKEGKRFLVQCKRYKGSVGVSVVREMFGVMISEKLDGVYLMTSGTFTKDCWTFAKGKPIELIQGEEMAYLLGQL